MAESTTWLADAGFDAGGIAGALLCLGLVAIIALVTGRSGRRLRPPAGSPIHRRTRQRRRRADDSDWGDSGDSGDSGGSGDSGSGCGSGCGGGGCGGGGGS